MFLYLTQGHKNLRISGRRIKSPDRRENKRTSGQAQQEAAQRPVPQVKAVKETEKSRVTDTAEQQESLGEDCATGEKRGTFSEFNVRGSPAVSVQEYFHQSCCPISSLPGQPGVG